MKLQNLFYNYILLERNLSKNSVEAYKRDIEHFYSYFATFSLLEKDVEKYLASLKLSSSSIARKVSVLTSLYKFLVANNYLEFSPMKAIKFIKRGSTIPKSLCVEELKLLGKAFPRDYLGVRNKLIFDILIYTGARISEVLSIRIRDINFEKELLKLHGKGDKHRIIPISKYLLKELDNYIQNFRAIFRKNLKEDKLFDITRNNFYVKLNRLAKTTINKSISPHMLRHTFATTLIGNGANIRHVQELLGHSDVSTTQIYTHISKDKLKSIYDSVNTRR